MRNNLLRTISFNQLGYTLDIPILDETHFVSWNTIDTILFGPEIIYGDHCEFIIYLNEPPVIRLKENAWWLNRLTFFMKIKKIKKIRVSDEWNKNFSDFIVQAQKYLPNVHPVDIGYDKRKGTLEYRTETKENNKIIIKQKWKPERYTGIKWEMVYDKYNRTVQDIYDRDKGI